MRHEIFSKFSRFALLLPHNHSIFISMIKSWSIERKRTNGFENFRNLHGFSPLTTRLVLDKSDREIWGILIFMRDFRILSPNPIFLHIILARLFFFFFYTAFEKFPCFLTEARFLRRNIRPFPRGFHESTSCWRMYISFFSSPFFPFFSFSFLFFFFL